jgi:hypothetical protein
VEQLLTVTRKKAFLFKYDSNVSKSSVLKALAYVRATLTIFFQQNTINGSKKREKKLCSVLFSRRNISLNSTY